MKVLILATHPIQYQAPLFRLLAKQVELIVIYCYHPNSKNQADAGFGVNFEWDIPLLDGYNFEFAEIKNPLGANTQTRRGLVLKDPNSILKKHRPDKVIVNGWFPHAMVQMIVTCAKIQIPVFVRGDSNLSMRESFAKKIFKELYFRWLFRKINGFLYVGDLNRKYYEHYGVSKNQLFFAPHSIDTEMFENRFLTKDKSQEVFVIGFLGKFIEVKNAQLIFRAVSHIDAKIKIKILMAGDGPLKAQLVAIANELKIDTEFLGFINQSELVNKVYSKIDVLVLPSLHETWGLVVNEAMTFGVPVIVSSNVGCANDLCAFTSNHSLIFENQNEIDLKENIIKVIKDLLLYKSLALQRIELYSIGATLKGFLHALNV